jgi:hypothetical protein
MVKVNRTEEYELKISRDKRGKFRWTMGVLNISSSEYDPEVSSPNQFKTESEAFDHCAGLFVRAIKAVMRIIKQGK